MSEAFKLIREVKALKIEPEDLIALKYDGHIDEYAMAGIKNAMASVLPDNKIIILEGGIDISHVRLADLETLIAALMKMVKERRNDTI